MLNLLGDIFLDHEMSHTKSSSPAGAAWIEYAVSRNDTGNIHRGGSLRLQVQRTRPVEGRLD